MDKNIINFTTGFFNWKKNNQLWIASDPVDSEVRWIIRPTNKQENQLELSYIRGGFPSPICVLNNPVELGFRAVNFRFSQILDYVYMADYVIQQSVLDNSKIFLQVMSEISYEFDAEKIDGVKEESSDLLVLQI